MLQNKTNKPIANLKGVVTKAFPTKQNDNGRWRPANFDIEIESGIAKVKQFPLSYWDRDNSAYVMYDPMRMPEWYNKLIAAYGDTLYSLVGSTVQIKGEGAINGTTMAIEYTVSGENFFVLDEESPDSIEEPATPVHKGPVPPPSIDPNQLRIMRQSTLGYSATLLSRKDFDTTQLMVEKTIEVAGKLLEYVISGEMPLFVEEVEPDSIAIEPVEPAGGEAEEDIV